MTEPLSSERVDEIRRWWTGPANTLPEFVAGDVLALCDTVESLRTENAAIKAFYDLTVQQRDLARKREDQLKAELVAKRRHAPGCLHDEPGVTICTCQPVESAELETLRGIAKRLADGWSLPMPWLGLGHRWFQYGDREPMTPAEVHAIWPEESD